MTRFGASDDVAEPRPGGRERRGPGLNIRSCLGAPDCAPQLSQEWTIYARAERAPISAISAAAPPPVATTPEEPPRCTLTIRHGVDAASFTSVVPIPASGLSFHVAGDWMSADIEVHAPPVPEAPPGTSTEERIIRCAVAAVPAAPRAVAITQRVPFTVAALPPSSTTSTPLLVDVPPFAVGVSGLRTVQSGAVLVSELARGTWHYRLSNTVALTALQRLTSATLNTYTPPGEFGGVLQSEGRMAPALPPVRSAGVAVPAGANALALDVADLTAAGASAERGAFDLQWLVQT